MSDQIVLRLLVSMIPREEGGRQGEVLDSYRWSMYLGERTEDDIPIVHDLVVVFEGQVGLAPGETGIARGWVIGSDAVPATVAPGFEAQLVEGHRPVANVRVLDVGTDATPFPIGDIRAAKGRRIFFGSAPPTIEVDLQGVTTKDEFIGRVLAAVGTPPELRTPNWDAFNDQADEAGRPVRLFNLDVTATEISTGVEILGDLGLLVTLPDQDYPDAAGPS